MHIIRYTLIRNNQVLSEVKGKCFKYRDLLLREDEFEMRGEKRVRNRYRNIINNSSSKSRVYRANGNGGSGRRSRGRPRKSAVNY